MMPTTVAPPRLLLASLLLWLACTTINVVDAATRGATHRRVRRLECGAQVDFHTYAFLDVQVNADPDQEELYQLEGAFGLMYNTYSRENYCDDLFREVLDVDVQYFEQLDASTVRFILSIDATSMGGSESEDLFSTSTQRKLAPSAGRDLKGSMKGSRSSDDNEEIGTEIETACTCDFDLGIGTPSVAEFTPVLGGYIDSLIEYGNLPSVISLVQLVEIDPVPCGEFTEFTSDVQVSFGSSKDTFNPMDLQTLPMGFLTVYNDLQANSCDSQFRRLVSVEAFQVDSRRLEEADTEGRDLQFNVLAFLLILNMVSRGTCFFCPSYLVLFDDAGRRQRELIERKQTGLCFCAAGTSLETGPPSSEVMRASFNEWIEEQTAAGVIQEQLIAEGILQVDETAPSTRPTTETVEPPPTSQPSTQPTSLPSTHPSSKPSVSPSGEPSAQPSSSPSRTPSTTPSVSPTTTPSTSPSSVPTSSPSSMPSSDPTSTPSLTPTSTPSFTPSSIPSAAPSVIPTGLPSESPSPPPTVMPTTQFPSAAPSFSTLCTPSENDTQLVYQTFEDGNVDNWENAKLESSEPAFTTFLGLYGSGDGFPVYNANFDTMSLNRMFFSFVFYEIDSWDGDGAFGPDLLSMRIDGEKNLFDVIQFGHFKDTFSEPSTSGNSTKNLIEWSIESEPIERSPQGFDAVPDQKHTILLGIPPIFYEETGSVKLTIAWNLKGDRDEFLGIDNFKVTACIDVVPSAAPSKAPTTSPA